MTPLQWPDYPDFSNIWDHDPPVPLYRMPPEPRPKHAAPTWALDESDRQALGARTP